MEVSLIGLCLACCGVIAFGLPAPPSTRIQPHATNSLLANSFLETLTQPTHDHKHKHKHKHNSNNNHDSHHSKSKAHSQHSAQDKHGHRHHKRVLDKLHAELERNRTLHDPFKPHVEDKQTNANNFGCAVCRMFMSEMRSSFTKLKNSKKLVPTASELQSSIGEYSWVSAETQIYSGSSVKNISHYGTPDNPAMFTWAFGDPLKQMVDTQLVMPTKVCGRMDKKLFDRCKHMVLLELLPKIVGGTDGVPGPTVSPLANTLCDFKCVPGFSEKKAADDQDEDEDEDGSPQQPPPAKDEVKFGIGNGATLQG